MTTIKFNVKYGESLNDIRSKRENMKRDCPCEHCECTTESSCFLIDPCPNCLMTHEEYNDYIEGLGVNGQ